jgi:hypothetical protein
LFDVIFEYRPSINPANLVFKFVIEFGKPVGIVDYYYIDWRKTNNIINIGLFKY